MTEKKPLVLTYGRAGYLANLFEQFMPQDNSYYPHKAIDFYTLNLKTILSGHPLDDLSREPLNSLSEATTSDTEVAVEVSNDDIGSVHSGFLRTNKTKAVEARLQAALAMGAFGRFAGEKHAELREFVNTANEAGSIKVQKSSWRQRLADEWQAAKGIFELKPIKNKKWTTILEMVSDIVATRTTADQKSLVKNAKNNLAGRKSANANYAYHHDVLLEMDAAREVGDYNRKYDPVIQVIKPAQTPAPQFS